MDEVDVSKMAAREENFTLRTERIRLRCQADSARTILSFQSPVTILGRLCNAKGGAK